MRRIICCITMITLLTGLWAKAESCTHDNLLMCSLRSECQDVGDGHQTVYTKSCVCDDCSENLVQRTYGPLMGHVFHLSESIHFEREGMHLWVFICPECWHVTLKEEACAGGDQCLTYTAQAGEMPAVQHDLALEDVRAWTDKDYIMHWISRKK